MGSARCLLKGLSEDHRAPLFRYQIQQTEFPADAMDLYFEQNFLKEGPDLKEIELPGLSDWAYFSFFKTLSAFHSYWSQCPADYEYYQERDQYFYNFEGHPSRNLTGRIIGRMMGWGVKKMANDRIPMEK